MTILVWMRMFIYLFNLHCNIFSTLLPKQCVSTEINHGGQFDQRVLSNAWVGNGTGMCSGPDCNCQPIFT